MTASKPDSADELSFAWVVPETYGWPGTDPRGGHPFERVCRRLFDTGKPFDRFGFLFVQDGHGPLRWFGAFAQHRRTMFFPGLDTPFDKVLYGRGTQTDVQSLALDHLTLERNRRRWHATSTASKEHLSATATLDLGENRILWFGLAIPALSSLRTVYERTEVRVAVPSSDSERRRSALISARDDVKFPLLSVPTDFKGQSLGFWHFSVVAGPRGFSHYNGPERSFPIGCPLVNPPLPSGLQCLTVRSVRLELSESLELEVAMMRLPGTLNAPALFLGPK